MESLEGGLQHPLDNSLASLRRAAGREALEAGPPFDSDWRTGYQQSRDLAEVITVSRDVQRRAIEERAPFGCISRRCHVFADESRLAQVFAKLPTCAHTDAPGKSPSREAHGRTRDVEWEDSAPGAAVSSAATSALSRRSSRGALASFRAGLGFEGIVEGRWYSRARERALLSQLRDRAPCAQRNDRPWLTAS